MLPKFGFLEEMVPLLVQVELTEACNLECHFCYNSQAPRYSDRIFQILDTLALQGVMQVNLTGGEPLKHPLFFDIVDRACSLFPNVVLLSNGALMTKTVVDRLHSTDLLSVNISIHGSASVHDSLTKVQGSYEASIAAIRHFIRKDKIQVASNFVLNAANLQELVGTIAYLGDIGLKYMTITRFIPVGIGKAATGLELTHTQLIKALTVVNDHNARNKAPHIEIAEAMPFCAVPRELRHLANCCSYGFDRFYVDVEGNLLMCGLSRVPLGGNVLKQNLLNIKKRSELFQCFIRDEHLHEECTMCDQLGVCRGGCRAAALSNSGWKRTKDPLMVGCLREFRSGR